MPIWLLEILKGLVPAILVAAVTSVVTVNLALRRFRQEKWWTTKEETYSQLLETLHHLKRYASEHLDQYHLEKSVDDATQKHLEATWKDSSAKLNRLEDLASFHLSATAVEILATYRKDRAEAMKGESFYEWIEGSLDAANRCLEALKHEAKRDLKIR